MNFGSADGPQQRPATFGGDDGEGDGCGRAGSNDGGLGASADAFDCAASAGEMLALAAAAAADGGLFAGRAGPSSSDGVPQQGAGGDAVGGDVPYRLPGCVAVVVDVEAAADGGCG